MKLVAGVGEPGRWVKRGAREGLSPSYGPWLFAERQSERVK